MAYVYGAPLIPADGQTCVSGPSPCDTNQPAVTMRHVVSMFAFTTHEAPLLRESGEQDQHQENEVHIHIAAADTHGLCR